MIGYVKTGDPENETDPKTYHCSACGAYISSSRTLVKLNGTARHAFVNPAGIRCNFLTFSAAENVIAYADLYLLHSWFPGYGWKFLMCAICSQHLGWKYESVRRNLSLRVFYGLLKDAVEAADA
jgi:hypothetical protein